MSNYPENSVNNWMSIVVGGKSTNNRLKMVFTKYSKFVQYM